MRVLKTTGSEAKTWIPCLQTYRGEPYATLSHRWLEDANNEVLFTDIAQIDEILSTHTKDAHVAVHNPQYTGANPASKQGYQKLRGAARRALHDGYRYLWADTVCIDKGSSAELSEAINSMFKWYAKSSVCYVYLVDVTEPLNDRSFRSSQWWKRGWTLQELLAPKKLTFFSSTWTVLGHRDELDTKISRITGIDPNIVNGTLAIQDVSIAQRMSWASRRVTTRIEDLAYCLLGIFDVNMPLLYGEGTKAFLRLQLEIMKDSDDESIFAWTSPLIPGQEFSGLLAPRPSAFRFSGHVLSLIGGENRSPYSMTNQGLSISLPMKHILEDCVIAKLHCVNTQNGNDVVCIDLKRLSRTGNQYGRVKYDHWAAQSLVNMRVKSIHVKQSHDHRPAYNNIGSERDRIRLLQVLPGEATSEVSIRIVEANINAAKYRALSYVWGATNTKHPIRANSQIVHVLDTIQRFLKSVRQQATTDLFWIDSICIQETDYLERSSQVTVMSDIFQNAVSVIVWLPESRTTTADVENIVTRSMPNKDSVNYTNFKRSAVAIRGIAKSSYWRRLWNVQELLLAKSITVQSHGLNVDIHRLIRAYRIASRFKAEEYAASEAAHDIEVFLRIIGKRNKVPPIPARGKQRDTTESVDDVAHYNSFFEDLVPAWRPRLDASALDIVTASETSATDLVVTKALNDSDIRALFKGLESFCVEHNLEADPSPLTMPLLLFLQSRSTQSRGQLVNFRPKLEFPAQLRGSMSLLIDDWHFSADRSTWPDGLWLHQNFGKSGLSSECSEHVIFIRDTRHLTPDNYLLAGYEKQPRFPTSIETPFPYLWIQDVCAHVQIHANGTAWFVLPFKASCILGLHTYEPGLLSVSVRPCSRSVD